MVYDLLKKEMTRGVASLWSQEGERSCLGAYREQTSNSHSDREISRVTQTEPGQSLDVISKLSKGSAQITCIIMNGMIS